MKMKVGDLIMWTHPKRGRNFVGVVVEQDPWGTLVRWSDGTLEDVGNYGLEAGVWEVVSEHK